IAMALPDQYSQILEMHERGDRSMLDCELEFLGFMHPELSAEALKIWELPEPIRNAVRDHHCPPDGLALATLLDAANQYVNASGVSILVNHGRSAADATRIETLGLNAEQLQTLLVEFREEHNAMSVYFR